jgi:hypothetical protein
VKPAGRHSWGVGRGAQRGAGAAGAVALPHPSEASPVVRSTLWDPSNAASGGSSGCACDAHAPSIDRSGASRATCMPTSVHEERRHWQTWPVALQVWPA